MSENKEIRKEIERPETDHLAMEVLERELRKSQAKDLGVIGLTIAVIGIAVSLSLINYKNDCDWRELFASYDFVSQDGSGYNNLNTGTQGDVNNGAKSQTEKR